MYGGENTLKNRSISRRTFLAGLAGGAALIAAGGWMLAGTKFGRSARHEMAQLLDGEARNLRQLMTKTPATSRRIVWQTKSQLKAAPCVELRDAAGKTAKVEAMEAFFADDGKDVYQYDTLLDDLQPASTYTYRIVEDGRAGDWQTLVTPATDQGHFKAFIFPDSQSSDYTDWTHLVEGAAKREPDIDFYINMGDLVDNGEDSTQWQAWFDAVATIAKRVPFVPVLGNHETYTLDWKVRRPEAYLHYFDMPDNGSADDKNYYYSFDYGDTHFVVLCTEWEEPAAVPEGIGDRQMAWLRRDLAANHKKWTIALLHRDVLQYRIKKRPERKEGISGTGEVLMPVFEEFGVDLVYTAHLHTYRDRGHLKDGKQNENGPLYILTGVAGNVRYPGLWEDHALDKVVAPQPETDNYITLEVDGDTLTSCCFLPDGTEIDRAVIQKTR